MRSSSLPHMHAQSKLIYLAKILISCNECVSKMFEASVYSGEYGVWHICMCLHLDRLNERWLIEIHAVSDELMTLLTTWHWRLQA